MVVQESDTSAMLCAVYQMSSVETAGHSEHNTPLNNF